MRQYWFLLFLYLTASCSEVVQKADPDAAGYAYYPLEVNRSWTYDRRYLSEEDTIADQVRVVVRESGDNNEGSRTFILDQYVRDLQEMEWKYVRTYSTWRNDRQAIRNLANQRTLEMVFPVEEGKEWNYNSMNIEDELRVAYLQAGMDFETWGPTVTIRTASLVGEQWEKVYAENIGLVFERNATEFEEWSLIHYE